MGKPTPELTPFHQGRGALSLFSWLVTALLLLGIGITPSQAATFMVSKTADSSDGACDADCSLREAITAANAGPGGEIIVIPPGNYPITIAGVEDQNASGDFDLLKDVTITGAGAGVTTINGGRLDRVFHVPGTATVAIDGLTITGGLADGDTYGGGIHNNAGSVTISNSTISDNWANSTGVGNGRGGGIYNGIGTLVLFNSTVDNNRAFGLVSNGYGGGICNNGGVVTVNQSTIGGNSANYGGGGIMNFATLILSDSTIRNNSANGGGGGLYNQGVSATVTVTNSTLFDNTATFWGGGLQNFSGNLTMINATISANSAPSGAGINRVGGTVTLTNTILANQNSVGAAANCGGTVVSNGHNLESANTCLFTGTGDLINTSPQLLGLGDNGGRTPTMPVPPSSPAVDAGTCLLPTDQRGMARPQGGGCDIGAYEYYPLTIIPSPADFHTVPVGSSAVQTFTLFNHSPAALTLTGMALAGSPAYTLDLNGGNTPCGSATPTINLTGATANYCTVGVIFAPLTPGLQSGTLTVTSNNTNPAATIVALTGIGGNAATTAPGAPSIGTATPGVASATVSFLPPASDGGSPITGYTVIANPGGQSASGPNSPLTVSGLTNGTLYTFTVTATNAVGQGPASAASNSVIPQAGAGPSGHLLDTNTVALWRLNETAASANAVDETGLYPLTQYGSPDAIAGLLGNARLLNGTSKFFQRAGDANLGTVFNGDWTYEGWVNLDPAGSGGMNLLIYNGLAFSFNQPDTILAEVGISPDRRVYWHQWQTTSSFTERVSTATLLPGQYYHVAVSRTAQGGNLFTYRIYVNGLLDTTTPDVPGPSYSVPGASHYLGLGNYTTIGGIGTGGNIFNGRLDDTRLSKIARTDAEILASFAASGPLPGAPIIGTATAGQGRATVSFTPPASVGGSPIIGYTVTASPGGATATGTASPIVITGLANGTAYTFTVTASNAAGSGPASAPSNSVIPVQATTPRLVAFYPFNGNGLDASGNGLHATTSNTAPDADRKGKAGQALHFGGNATALSPALPTLNSFSIAGWVKWDRLDGWNPILDNVSTCTRLEVDKDQITLSSCSAEHRTPSQPLVAGAWYHLAATYDDGTRQIRYYLNGSPIATMSAPEGMSLSGPVHLGDGPSGAQEYLSGTLDAVRIYSVVLGANEVATLAAGPNVPGTPVMGAATPGRGKATVTFTAPATDGGSPITRYRVIASPGGKSVLGATSPLTVGGLANGTPYTFTVRAINGVGLSPASAPSNSVTPSTVPAPPTTVVATALSGRATVTFSPPAANGGSPITGYRVLSNPAGGLDLDAGSTATTHTVTGLANGTAYTFTVKATNAVGPSPASLPSNSVTPSTPALARTAWLLGSAETDPARQATGVVVFLDANHYLFAREHSSSNDPNCYPLNAIEQGTYAWDPLTGAFSATASYQTPNLNCGMGDLQATITVNGGVMTIDPPGPVTIPGYQIAPTATNPMAGTWSVFDPAQPQNAMALVVFNNTRYLLLDHSAPSGLPTECGTPGLEHGTYLWAPASGGLTANALIDTNGCWGLGPALPPGSTLSIIGNTLTVTVPGEGDYPFTRLE